MALELSKAMRVSTPSGAPALQVLGEAIQAGYGNRDSAATLDLREDQAGVQVRSGI